MGLFEGSGLEGKIRKLKAQKSDLTDDSRDITKLNKDIDKIESDLESFLGRAGAAPIIRALPSYREPSQSSDSALTSACSYIQSEITALERRLEAERRAAAAAAEAAKNGGGGSW